MLIFEKMARSVTKWTGSSLGFSLALASVVLWFTSGPYFEWSIPHSLLINTGTTIATFLMVFLIQRSQNKDSAVLHMKLNELIASIKGPSNRLICIEELTEGEIAELGKHYHTLAVRARDEKNLTVRHTIEEVITTKKV